ncbi:MAG: S1 family peptidase [Pseudolabrys sp.]
MAIVGLLLGVVPASSQDTALSAARKKPAAAIKRPAPQAAAWPALSTPEALAAGKSLDQQLGWDVVMDPATGIRIGLPAKMVPVTREAASGTRWSSRHGDVQIETFRIKTNESLAALFEAQKRQPANRRPESSLMKDDNFFISGLQGLKKFSVHAQLRDGELRGFVMLFDQAMEGVFAPVLVAMSSAFAPFPSTSTPFATLAKPVEYATGIVVSANGYIVTDRKAAENCQVIVASGVGNAERVDSDVASGLALLRVYGRANLTPVALAADAPQSAELKLLGIADPHQQNGGRELSEVKASLTDGAAIEFRHSIPVAGFSGAAALDNQDRVIGMMETRNAVVASTGPAVPPVRLISAAAIRSFLAAHHVAAAASGGDPNAAVVRIICVRK